MRYANILAKESGEDTGKDLYSVNADGIYQGFYGATGWEDVYKRQHHFLRKSIQDVLKERKGKLKSCTTLCIRVNRHKNLPEGFYAGFITSDGYTHKTICSTPSPEGIIRIPLKKLHQADTALLPIAYPTFLKQYFHPETDIPFQMEKRCV